MGSFYLVQDSLSNIQFYYTQPDLIQESSLIISGEEVQHIARVMRNKVGDTLNITDGKGNHYISRIERIDKKVIHCSITSKHSFTNNFINLIVCIPRLKNADRFEMALEKCVELGITRFIIYESERTTGKGDKSERWQKIALAAMKQCQRTFLPEVKYMKSIMDLNKLDSKKMLFEQNAEMELNKLLHEKMLNMNDEYILIFGPEGGFSKNEMERIENTVLVNMNTNRLRSETAIISAVSIITNYLTIAR
jgi:16S rRNA (uracil1498-N3)-methyltransferase